MLMGAVSLCPRSVACSGHPHILSQAYICVARVISIYVRFTGKYAGFYVEYKITIKSGICSQPRKKGCQNLDSRAMLPVIDQVVHKGGQFLSHFLRIQHKIREVRQVPVQKTNGKSHCLRLKSTHCLRLKSVRVIPAFKTMTELRPPPIHYQFIQFMMMKW